MASVSCCDTCSRRSKESTAVMFCSDCEEALCTLCLDAHNMFKAFSTHHIVDISVATGQSFAVNKVCDKHNDMALELYCSDHDIICCRTCMASDHRICSKLLPIDVVARDVKTSTMFEDVSKEVDHLNKTTDQLDLESTNIRSTFDESRADVLRRLKETKAALLKRIDEIESQLEMDIDTTFAKQSTKVADDQRLVQQRIKDIREISNQFEFVAKHGSDSHIFILLNSMKTTISRLRNDVEHFVPTLKFSELKLHEPDSLSSLRSLGTVAIEERPCDLQYEPPKIKQAQNLQQPSRAPTKFQLENKIKLNAFGEIWISGIGVTGDGRLILCNWKEGNNVLIVLSENGQFIQTIKVDSAPWGIALSADTDEAWVTLPSANNVQVFNTASYMPVRLVKSPGACSGITFVNDNVALGGNGKVYIINKQGVQLKELNIGGSKIYSLSGTIKDKIYCCQSDNDLFRCINMDGTEVFSYRYPGLRRPVHVTTDAHHNVYVLAYVSNNLHRLSADGNSKEIMIEKRHGLNSPYTFAFNRHYSKIFVPNRSDSLLLIFTCI